MVETNIQTRTRLPRYLNSKETYLNLPHSPPIKMASAAAVETHSDGDEEEENGDEEYEYEEIEVEEEIIEEIEVEVDEEEQESETIGEALTPINKENHQNDNSPSKEFEYHKKIMKSSFVIPTEFIANAPDNPILGGGSKGNPENSASSHPSKREESSGSRTPEDHFTRASVGDCELMVAESMKRSGGEMNVESSAVSADKRVDGVQCVEEETNEVAAKAVDGVQCVEEETDGIAAEAAVDISKRLGPNLIRQRSLSPEPDGGTKRAAIICNFFAKGWCIKGKSCRFLHVRDKVVDESQFQEAAADVAKQKSEPPLGEVSSVTQNSANDGESAKWKSDDGGLPSQKDDHGSFSSPKHFGRESLGQKSYLDLYNRYAPQSEGSSAAYGNGQFRGAFSGSPLMSCDSNKRTSISPGIASFGEGIFNRTHVSLGDDSFPVSSHCLKRSSLSFSSRSWDTDPTRVQKCLDPGMQYQSSIFSSFRNSSSFPGSELGYHSQANFLGNKLQCPDFKSDVSFGNWEPSVPFRPSYLITQELLSKENLYDPVHDCIEQTKCEDGRLQFSPCGPGTSKGSAKLQEKPDTGSAGTVCAEFSSSNNNSHGNGKGKSFHEKDMSTTELDVAETSFVEKQSGNNSLMKDERSLTRCVQDIREADKIDVDCDSGLQGDKSKHMKELKIDSVRLNNDADVDLRTDGSAQESKALRNFHAALVEHVKELIRPSWHEGLLSRDAYKVIVKKSVDKVLSTFLPDQIPNTSELVEQYLIVSQTKLAKLVEAYVEKYGKS